MSKPNYRATLTFDPDRKVFLARAPELEHCTGEGPTRAEAIANLEQEIDAQLANMLSHGSTPPRAVDEETFSGEITAKVSRLLHRDLAYQARSEGIELDHLVGELLAAAMESRKQTRGLRSGNRQPQEHMPHDNVGNRYEGGGQRNRGFGGRGHNPAIMDDRANFIEYVRGLEQNGGTPGRHGGGPGGGDRGRRRGRGGGGGRGGNPNHHGGGHNNNNRGMQGGGRPMGNGPQMGNGGGGANGGNPGNGAGYNNESAPASAASQHSTPHDPDSSGNA
jgi:predicted RNase H-like HicB family nuclease